MRTTNHTACSPVLASDSELDDLADEAPVSSSGSGEGLDGLDDRLPSEPPCEGASGAFPRAGWVGDESDRTRLIAELMKILNEPRMPETARTAGLTLIGWLARRMPGEAPHALGVEEARASERRLRAARKAR